MNRYTIITEKDGGIVTRTLMSCTKPANVIKLAKRIIPTLDNGELLIVVLKGDVTQKHWDKLDCTCQPHCDATCDNGPRPLIPAYSLNQSL